MAFNENLAEYFDPAEFATSVVWSGSATPINVIFDAEHRDPLGLVESTGPVALVPMSSVPNVAHGQTLTVDSVVYRIAKVLRNHGGPGMALLILAAP